MLAAVDVLTTGAHLRMMRNAAELGARVTQLRKALGVDQDYLVEQTGLSRAYISRLENGGVLNPKLYDLANVAAALRTNVADLTGDHVTNDDEAMIRNILNAKLGSASGDQVSRVLDQLAERPEQDRRALLHVISTLAQSFPRMSPASGDQ